MAIKRYVLLLILLAGITALRAQHPETSGDSIKVKIYFALDKYNISPAAKATLDDFIKNHREITWINIEAFTDSRASVAYNDVLAMNRAKSAQNYLLTNGLSKLTETHINAFGKRKLLDQGTTEAAHQNNRVVILTCYVVSPFLAAANQHKDTVKPAPPVLAPPPAPAPPKDTVKPTPAVVAPPPPPPAPPKDTVKPAPTVIQAPPVVSSSPAEVVKTAPPPPPPAPDTVIEVKESVPTGEIDHGLTERIIQTIVHAKVGQSFVLHTIYFEEGRHVFVPTANTALNAVLEAMKARPTLVLEVQGHVCCTDSLMADALDFDTHRFDLSYARAKAVAAYLVKNGIAAERVQDQVGFGSRRRLVFPEKTLADRNLNRRVQFKILKK